MPHLSASDMPARGSWAAEGEMSAETSFAMLPVPSFPATPKGLRISVDGPAASGKLGWVEEDLRRTSSSVSEGMPSDGRVPRKHSD